ncbi:hypothetical protein MASR2M18_05150 [Ignavibacteria bacterium]|jgi:serine/threonine-protein kinase RsbW|nr:ATP-binding protein [Bacteroidota bacterium]MCZ2132025.1 ATP-binding protein [Bacteroidota bacterium]
MAQALFAQDASTEGAYILRMPSERNNILRVEPFFNSLPESKELDEVLFYNIMIASTEAVNNAIIHGNGCNPNKMIELSVFFSMTGVTISVTDEGDGFTPEEIADPTAPENILREGGRGVFLMRALAKSIEFFAAPGRSGVVMRF